MHIIGYDTKKAAPQVEIEMNTPVRVFYKLRLYDPSGNGKLLLERLGHNMTAAESSDKHKFSLETKGDQLHGATATWQFTVLPAVAGERYSLTIRLTQNNKTIKSIPAYEGSATGTEPVHIYDDAVLIAKDV